MRWKTISSRRYLKLYIYPQPRSINLVPNAEYGPVTTRSGADVFLSFENGQWMTQQLWSGKWETKAILKSTGRNAGHSLLLLLGIRVICIDKVTFHCKIFPIWQYYDWERFSKLHCPWRMKISCTSFQCQANWYSGACHQFCQMNRWVQKELYSFLLNSCLLPYGTYYYSVIHFVLPRILWKMHNAKL